MPAAALIRAAQPQEADLLTALMHRSKAHWGYSAAFLAQALPFMQITAADIQAAVCVDVLENADGAIMGFCHLRRLENGKLWLEDLFIEPDAIGQGCGKTLFQHCLAMVQQQGADEFCWESDPHAQPFYEKMGAAVIGEQYHPETERSLPVMQYRFAR